MCARCIKKALPDRLPMLLGAASLLGVVMLTSCVVGPEFKKPPVAAPAHWSAKDDPRIATQTAVDGQWWRSFKDSTLDHLVELATNQNLPLQVAGLRIMEARAQLAIATGRQYPQVQELFGSATAEGISKTAPNGSFLPEHRFGDYQLGFDAVWEMDFWGKYRRGIQAETANALASITDYYAALVSLTAEVVRTYVVIRTTEVLIAQTQENVRIQEDGLAIAQSRFKNGATSELDPSQATTLLESTRATLPPLQVQLEQARNALSTLLGTPAGSVNSLLAGAPRIPLAPSMVGVDVPAELLRRRPDIRTAELHAAAQCAQIGVATADLYPSFSIAGVLGLETSNTASSFAGLNSGSLFYAVGPQIHWPFLNYGRLTNAVRVQDARFQQLLVGYQDTVLKAVQEVEDALSGFLNAQNAMVPNQNAVTSAQRSVAISMAQYREGAVDYQRVLDSERVLLEQQILLSKTLSSVDTNLIALYKALGGGWELEQGKTVVPNQTQHEMNDRTNWGDMLSQPVAPETKSPPPSVRERQGGSP